MKLTSLSAIALGPLLPGLQRLADQDFSKVGNLAVFSQCQGLNFLVKIIAQPQGQYRGYGTFSRQSFTSYVFRSSSTLKLLPSW